MKLQSLAMFLSAHLVLVSSAQAQESSRSMAGVDEERPSGVSMGQKTEAGAVFVDARGMTLYALNARLAASRSGASLKFCTGPCALIWAPLVAPADAMPVGPWKVVEGAQGPQWSYKGNPVFTYIQDKAPGSTAGDGYEDLWKALVYVPPAPSVVAPASVTVVFVEGAYIMADRQGRALFTTKAGGVCGAACAQPLVAGMANQPIGDWTLSRDGDRPQWTYRGKPVYVSPDEERTRVPAVGIGLRP
jgi:predicted lipoprotein with Yx(FWY)xxD motif